MVGIIGILIPSLMFTIVFFDNGGVLLLNYHRFSPARSVNSYDQNEQINNVNVFFHILIVYCLKSPHPLWMRAVT
jgi:hypothetical protein